MSRVRTVDFGSAPFLIIDGDRGKNYPKQDEFSDDGFCMFLSATNVTKNGLDFSQCQFITEQKDSLLRKGKLQRDDVVLTTRGTIGNSAFYSESVPFENLRINSGMVVLRCDQKEILPSYLYHFLRSPQFHGQVNSLRSGAAQPQLPIRDMRSIKLPIPSLRMQQSITSILSAYDDLIENNRRRIQLLEQTARLLYKEWFVHLRFPGHEHVKIKNGVPEGWEEGVVSDFFSTASGGTPSRKKPDFYSGDIPWVKTRELTGGFILSTGERITEEAIKSSSAKLFPRHTVLVAMYGATIGQTAILSVPSSTNQACCAVIPSAPGTAYVHAYLFFNHHKLDLVGLGQGAAQNNISQQVIRAFKMVLPEKTLLDVFSETTSPLFEQIEILQKMNIRLMEARDLLLPRLMNGEVAV